jgi:hypothetical protein
MKILDIPRSGSYAGNTSSHNRAGQYVRNRRVPTNAPTARRTAIRSAMGASSSAWSSLTDSQRAAWIAAADAHPVTDRLGSSIKLTGHQLFVSCSTALLNAGGASPTVPPVSFDVYSLVGSTFTFGIVAGIALTLPATGTSADYLLVSFSRPLPAGRSFWNTFSQHVVDTGDVDSEAVTTAVYGAQYGTPLAGQRVFCKLTPVNQYGVTGVPVVLSAVVTA